MVVGIDYFPAMKATEVDIVDALLREAFGGREEADLVRRLRADGDMWHETVAHLNGEVAGYMALSRMRSPKGWACLAPVAVLPKYQNGAGAPDPSSRSAFRVGSRMVGMAVAGLASLRDAELEGRDLPHTVVVLGKRSFYERAGFSSARARRLVSPYPLEHTLIARPGDDVPEETLLYPRAFDALG
ncbi:GNAT family N-acetyltransferase [Hwanghaeella sp.]|uniref:GNAT family N-acetyltransferase n=1 Tax=Hwanghaeella sp. TaxID=2605943 RepID=UPI003CCC02EA